MPTTFTSSLRISKQGQGENDNTWGTIENTDDDLLDEAIAGVHTVSVTTGSNITLTTSSGASDQARHATLKLSGTPTANIDVIVPAVEKVYNIEGSGLLGSNTVTIKPTGGGDGVAFGAGESAVVICDGTDVKEIVKTVTAFQTNMIMLWGGTIANIPAGWGLCDGTNGTPDLRDRFIVGAREDEASDAKTNLTGSLTVSGGDLTTASGGAHSHTGSTQSHTLTLSQIPSHSHNISLPITFHDTGAGGVSPTWSGPQASQSAAAAVSTNTQGGGAGHTHGISEEAAHTHEATPPYYALAYIMKL